MLTYKIFLSQIKYIKAKLKHSWYCHLLSRPKLQMYRWQQCIKNDFNIRFIVKVAHWFQISVQGSHNTVSDSLFVTSIKMAPYYSSWYLLWAKLERTTAHEATRILRLGFGCHRFLNNFFLNFRFFFLRLFYFSSIETEVLGFFLELGCLLVFNLGFGW